ncbi:MAG: uncharacterized protein QOD77_1964 [Thermoplasmata archaeon]|nr:uncharacterized protein [Thermoplasmata archaeon]
MTLTLVPESLASAGARFTFRGANAAPDAECAGCPLQKMCFGLQAGATYQVTGVREVTHPCALHDGGRAHVVTVEPAAVATSLETRLLRGTAATWSAMPCARPECPSYALCHPAASPSGARYAIEKDEGALPCPAGYDLSKVRLKLLPG